MNNDLAIITRSALSIAFTDRACQAKEAALATAAMVGRVTNQKEQEAAVNAQKEIHTLIKLVEKAEEEAKRPLNDARASIISKCREFLEELKSEMTRISTATGTFQQQQLARQRAEEQARNEKLLEIEREKAKALAKANSEAETDAIQEHFNNKAAAEAPPPVEAPRAEGQRLVQTWEIKITDLDALYRFHRHCCKIEPRQSEIIELLKGCPAEEPLRTQWLKMLERQGISATPVVKASVRVAPERKAITV